MKHSNRTHGQPIAARPQPRQCPSNLTPTRPAPTPEVSPDWFETPEPPDYTLCLWNDGETKEWISVSRREYIGLKRELARMRGFTMLPEEEDMVS